MSLKSYNAVHKKIDKENKTVGTIPSGFKSPDSDSEMMIVEPIKRHPEIRGMVRAIDKKTKWLGWVPYKE